MIRVIEIIGVVLAIVLALRYLYCCALALDSMSRSLAIVATLYLAWAADSEQENLEAASVEIVSKLVEDES